MYFALINILCYRGYICMFVVENDTICVANQLFSVQDFFKTK